MSLLCRAGNTKHIGRYIYVAIFLMATGALNLSAWSQSTYQPEKAPAWRYQVPASPMVDTRTTAEISAEDKYSDTCCGASDPLDGPQRMGIGRSGPAEFYEEFPARFRDEVVVAHFSTWTDHLSTSRCSIYTVVNLQIDRVVIDKVGELKAGETLPIFVPGGTVLAPTTGKVISYFIRADDFPLEPNTEYLIFLNRQPPYPSYQYMKAWNVSKGVLEPTTSVDLSRVTHGLSTHNGESLEDAIHDLTSH